MADKAKGKTTTKTKTNETKTNLIMAICAIVLVLVLIVISVVMASRNQLGDSYFVSDGSKYVLNIAYDDALVEEGQSSPVSLHVVYYYSGNDITGVKEYYEFADEATAKTALEFFTQSENNSYKAIEQSGKYVIVTINEADYEGLTAEIVKQNIEAFEAAANSEEATPEEDTGEVVEETTEVVEVTEPTEEVNQ